MKQFLDFLPLVVFFAFYKLYDIYAATTALIVATAVVLIYSWVRYRKVEKMALITFVLVAVFGGLTIFFHNDEFIKWKVTVIYALFAGALLFSQWVMKKPLIQRMLGKELSLPQQVWSRLNLAWAVFFILCGLANIYIAFWLPQNIWVNFKVFGLTALTLVFTLLSGIYIYRHMPQDDTTNPSAGAPSRAALAPYKLTALANIPCNHTTSAHTLTASRPHCEGSLHDFSQLHKKLR